jgi:hypothetical protein
MRRHLFNQEFFALGVNLAWLDGYYDHDLGRNEVMGHDSGAYSEYLHKENLDAYFKDISRMNVRVVRLFLFERFEGLKFDQKGNVTGIDDDMMNNIANVMDVARKHNLRLYLCLMDTWGVSVQSQEHLERLNDIILNEQVRKSFIDNVLKSFLSDSRIRHDSIFAIDVMNEPEGLYTSIWRADLEWVEIIDFIRECTAAIHEKSRFRVSCGFQHYQTLVEYRKELNGLDFYDYHEFNDDGTLIPYSNLGIEKPCIIGACGQRDEKYDDKIQHKAAEGFLKNAWRNDYAGCIIWNYNYKGYDTSDAFNRYSLIKSSGEWREACNSVVKFGKQHRNEMLL